MMKRLNLAMKITPKYVISRSKNKKFPLPVLCPLPLNSRAFGAQAPSRYHSLPSSWLLYGSYCLWSVIYCDCESVKKRH